MKVEAPEIERDKRACCPFCKNLLEFQVNETIELAQVTFHCLVCRKRFIIEKL